MTKSYIIAEAGVNHNGSLEIARKLVDAAVLAGVDCVKFQTFKAENLVTRQARTADYQKRNTVDSEESQFEMLKKLELSFDDHKELMRYCKGKGVAYLSTAFDMESVAFLQEMNLEVWKIPSGEITNYPFLRRIAQTGKKMILSTGMASIQEIADAISVLEKFGTQRANISLLHCTTEYPAPKDEINLKVIPALKEYFGLEVGYSDHTEGIDIPVLAVALGANIIEKHFTLDKTMDGPDHRASIEPAELKRMVQNIRLAEQAMGTGEKQPTPSELRNLSIARKSIVASRPIGKGELFDESNLTTKRPFCGLSPMQWESVIGQPAMRDFDTDEAIQI